MRITFILPTVGMSGGIRVVAIYALALAARGHRVTLVSPPPRRLPFAAKLRSWLKGDAWPHDVPSCPSYLDDCGLDHRVLEGARPVVDADVPDADIVIATWWETAEWVVALGARKGAKVYFIQHHEVFPPLPLARCRATYRLPLHKIVIARWLETTMRMEYDDSVVDLVPNSVDQDQFFAPLRGKQAVPTVGFLYARAAFKGLDIALAALAIVRRRRPELRMVCFGTERPAPPLLLPAGTEFTFSPPQDRIRTLYAQCDVWITASRSEGFNLPAMEAMACRTPVVATRTGWPDEVIESGSNGVLVEVDDVAGLARGMERILALGDAEWRAMSQRAHDTACRGSWSESTLKFEQALVHASQRSARGEIAGICAGAQVDVTVVLVSYNTAGLMMEAVTALRQSLAGLTHEIIIVDNASRDDSVALIERECTDCTLIRNEVNVGFGRANNQALEGASGRYVLLLNTDAFVRPDTVAKTVAYMDAHPRSGILGVNLVGRDGALQPSARYFPTPLNIFLNQSGLSRIFRHTRLVDDMSWDQQSVRQCDWVPGCYFLVRKAVIDAVGLFDPRYFLYYEEIDHCYAARKAGWEVVCFPDTTVVHIGGESAKSAGAITAGGSQLEAMQIESEFLYFRKNLGLAALLADVLLTSLADAVNVAKSVLKRKAPIGAEAAWRRAGLLWSLLRRTHLGTRATR